MRNVAPVEVAAGYALEKVGGAGWLGSVHMTGKQLEAALAATSAAIFLMPRVIHSTPRSANRAEPAVYLRYVV